MTPETQDPALQPERIHLRVVDCESVGLGPCPDRECRYHVASGSTRSQPPEDEPHCTLAIARAAPNGLSLDAVGYLLGVSYERVRQIEVAALAKMATSLEALSR